MSKKINLDHETEQYLLKVLRRATLQWKGRNNALKKCRKKLVDGKRKKFFWQCSICKNWEDDIKMMEVDHIDEIGNYSGDVIKQIEIMYSEENLQVLCISCHRKKTAVFNSSRIHKRDSIEEKRLEEEVLG